MVAAARDQLDATAQAQGVFGLVYLVTVGTLSWVMGLLADRFGYRLVGCLAGCLMAGAFLLCLLTREMRFWYGWPTACMP